LLSNGVKIDPRVVRTRKLLVDAFLQVQRTKDFEDLTIQDITDQATVNRATFYAHFQDKYDLLEQVIHDGFAITLEKRLNVPIHSQQAHLRQLLLAISDHLVTIQSNCQRSYRMFGSMVEAQIKAQVRDHIRAWLAEDLTFRNVSPQQRDIAASIVTWSLYAAALEGQERASQSSINEIAEQTLPLINASIEALLA
jgi:AcrR family transcriptional regulator